jgi:deoxyribonuclease-4
MDKINNIKFGLKLWSTDQANIKEAKKMIEDGTFDYIELMAVPNTNISLFLETKLPYIIHIPHDRFGFNIADKEKEGFNLDIINKSIEWANELSAEYLILHPGLGEIEVAVNFLEKINDKRILIENMPKVGANGEKMVGYTPEQIKELTKNKFGFCLDFVHAIKAGLSIGVNYKDYVKEFLDFNPKVFHIYDDTLVAGSDAHMNIGEGEYDFKFLLDCIRSNSYKMATLETPKNNFNSLEDDFMNIKKLKSLL